MTYVKYRVVLIVCGFLGMQASGMEKLQGSELESLHLDLQYFVLEKLSVKDWEILETTSHFYKSLITTFLSQKRLFSCKKFDINMGFRTSYALSPHYFCIFNQYGTEATGISTMVDYYHASTLAHHTATLVGTYDKPASGTNVTCPCPKGILVYQAPEMKLLTVNEFGIDVSTLPLQISGQISGHLKSMACSDQMLLVALSYDSQIGCWDLLKPEAAPRIQRVDHASTIQCYGDRFFARTYKVAWGPPLGSAISKNSQFHVIDPSRELFIEKSLPCEYEKIKFSVDGESDAILFCDWSNCLVPYRYGVGLSTDQPKSISVDLQPNKYLITHFILKGHYVFWVGSLGHSNDVITHQQGVFSVYDLKSKTNVDQQFWELTPQEMHLVGTELFIPVKKIDYLNGENSLDSPIELIHSELKVINVKGWL